MATKIPEALEALADLVWATPDDPERMHPLHRERFTTIWRTLHRGEKRELADELRGAAAERRLAERMGDAYARMKKKAA